MLPDDQRLASRDLPRTQRDHRLVAQPQLFALDRAAQVGVELELGLGVRVHGGVEHGVPGAAQILGAVHGRVGVAQQLLGPRVRARSHRYADGGGGEHLGAVQIVGSGERLLHAFGSPHRLVGVGEVAEQQGELVSSQARHRVPWTRHLAQAARDLHQQHVPLRMPKALVHRLEPVDVQEQHREAVVRAPLLESERLPQAVHEQRPVGQAGEPVVEGVVQQLLLGTLALGDVRLRARQPVRFAGAVPDRRPAHQHPAPTSVQVPQPVLGLKVRRAPLEVQAQVAEQPLAIVGVDPIEPLVGIVAQLGLLRPQLLLPAGGEEDLVFPQVPVPEAVVAAQGGERIALLALAHRLLGAPALGNVAGDALHPDRHLSAVDQAALQLQRNAAPVLGQHLHLEGLHLAGEVLLHGAPVLGRHQVPDAQPQGLVARIAGDALAGAIHPGEPALEVVGIDDVAGVLHQLPVVRVFHSPMVSGARRAGKQRMVHSENVNSQRSHDWLRMLERHGDAKP